MSKPKILLLDYGVTVCEDGSIYGSRGKLLKLRKNKSGYLMVRTKKGWKFVHRLLSLAFIPNPENLETINHKDSNKENNSLSNLEWVSRKENLYHAMDNNKHAWGRKAVVDSFGNVYVSQAEAARQINGCQGNIKRAINTKGNYYGRKWYEA